MIRHQSYADHSKPSQNLPRIIQGGMGIAVSSWHLARVVSLCGELGVVSGTAINSVLVRRLQKGDPDGSTRRALKSFPNPQIAERILDEYFVEGGLPAGATFKRSPVFAMKSSLALLQLTVVASFVEVFLAREGHDGWVGINLLEKVALPNLPTLFGALLAGVKVVLMGAGIPREIPGALDAMSNWKPARLKIPVVHATQEHFTEFDPVEVMEGQGPQNLVRPLFFPIVSSSVLASSLQKKATGRIDGFVVESPLAGGHNAPPRGPLKLSERGEPIYGPRDLVEMSEMKALGLPFWMAGYYATPEKLKEVLAAGAQGIQVGTLFAFSNDSGLDPELRKKMLQAVRTQTPPPGGWVFTDPVSSPTGFPFKAVRLNETLSENEIYQKRRRICDLGYLRHAYVDKPVADSKAEQTPTKEVVRFRCSAEPVEDYLRKGGSQEETQGKKCLCNALMADIGLGQNQKWGAELPLLTAGDDLNEVARVLQGREDYSAQDVLIYLKGLNAEVQNQRDSVSQTRQSPRPSIETISS